MARTWPRRTASRCSRQFTSGTAKYQLVVEFAAALPVGARTSRPTGRDRLRRRGADCLCDLSEGLCAIRIPEAQGVVSDRRATRRAHLQGRSGGQERHPVVPRAARRGQAFFPIEVVSAGRGCTGSTEHRLEPGGTTDSRGRLRRRLPKRRVSSPLRCPTSSRSSQTELQKGLLHRSR